MLITDIEIRDFKTIRHLRWSNIPDHGVFVIHGDNEQGKSTVLEAIAQVLHTKHSSRAQAVKDTQPLGSDVGPQVTVNLTLGGKNVRLLKQWLKTPRAELTISGDGSYTGGDAEQRFEEFFHKHVDQTLFTAQNGQPNPASGWNNADDVLVKARRAAALGLRVMIDFHFSDSWADPGQQTVPAAWAGYDLPQMKTAVAAHVTSVLTKLKSFGITPEWVQVGNETRTGMLWPLGSSDNGRLRCGKGRIPRGQGDCPH